MQRMWKCFHLIQKERVTHCGGMYSHPLIYSEYSTRLIIVHDHVKCLLIDSIPYMVQLQITKWKHSRTMLLVVFKSAPILKRCLKIRLVCLFSPLSSLISSLQAIFQIYVLKLLKMQSRYLGRQWRRCNMDVITSIYSKLRHT